jgi:alpha-amylase
LGHTRQNEAVHKLYSIGERVRLCTDRRIKQDWNYLQASDHFFYMSTKHNDDGSVHSHYSPYDSPYTAFTNYMNVLSDFMTRVEEQYPASIDNEELNSLLLTIRNQEQEIERLHREVEMMRNNIVNDTTGDFPIDEPVPAMEEKPAPEPKPEKKPEKKPAAKKPAAKKPADKKAEPKKAPAKKAPAKKAEPKKAPAKKPAAKKAK